MKITKELLIEKGACSGGVRWFEMHFPGGGELDDLIQRAEAQECPTDFIWWFYDNVYGDKRLLALCGVNGSSGVSRSNGVSWSSGVSRSDGVSGSSGVNGSFGCHSCHGIDNCLFCCEATGRYLIFNKPASAERVSEIRQTIYGLLGNWHPVYNNIKALYLAHGSDWKLTPVHNAEELSIKGAWSGMPAEAIEYVRSLPEFDADIFGKVTGIGQEESRA